MFVVYFGSVFGVVVVQRKMVGSRRICILVVHLQMKGQVVVDEGGSDVVIGQMIDVVIVLPETVVVAESVEVEVVVAAVVDVEVEEEPLEADKAVAEYCTVPAYVEW